MIDEATFWDAMHKEPDNFDLRLVFADWLEEQGDWRAEGMRWLGENKKRPLFFEDKSEFFGWNWMSGEWLPGKDRLSAETLHVEIRMMQKLGIWRSFPSMREAEEAFCKACPKLKEHCP